MAEFVSSARIDWRVHRETDSDIYLVTGTSTLRDRPIELALTVAELATLGEFLRRIAAIDSEVVAVVCVTADH